MAEVTVRLNVTGQEAIAEARSEVEGLASSARQVTDNVGGTGGNVTSGAAGAIAEFGRASQSAQGSVQGAQGALQGLVVTFGNLRRESGSSTQALADIGTTLASGGAVILGLQLLITFLPQIIEFFEDADDGATSLNQALSNLSSESEGFLINQRNAANTQAELHRIELLRLETLRDSIEASNTSDPTELRRLDVLINDEIPALEEALRIQIRTAEVTQQQLELNREERQEQRARNELRAAGADALTILQLERDALVRNFNTEEELAIERVMLADTEEERDAARVELEQLRSEQRIAIADNESERIIESINLRREAEENAATLEANAIQSLEEAKATARDAGLNALRAIFADSEAAAIAFLAVEKGLAIAEVITNTAAGQAAAVAAAAPLLANPVTAAAGSATLAATTSALQSTQAFSIAAILAAGIAEGVQATSGAQTISSPGGDVTGFISGPTTAIPSTSAVTTQQTTTVLLTPTSGPGSLQDTISKDDRRQNRRRLGG